MELIETYAEHGALGVCVVLLAFLVVKLSSNQTENSDSLKEIETRVENVESMVIKLIDRWNKSDETMDRRHEDLINEMNDISDVVMELKGSVSRINGK